MVSHLTHTRPTSSRTKQVLLATSGDKHTLVPVRLLGGWSASCMLSTPEQSRPSVDLQRPSFCLPWRREAHRRDLHGPEEGRHDLWRRHGRNL